MFNLLMMLDPLYWILIGPALLLALVAQLMVKGAFAKWSREPNRSGISGAQAAREILRRNGLANVDVAPAHGLLSDHYDPTRRIIRLSPDVYQGRTVAAVGVAAHETGHAIQHARGFVPMRIRSALYPVVSIGSALAFPIIFFGMILGMLGLMKVGIVLFAGVVAFQIITLPVEFDASRRAKRILAETGIVTGPQEARGVRAVLNAAALTYVAAAIAALAQLLYFILRARR
jgi:Zn-dependent membrane protease YugP